MWKDRAGKEKVHSPMSKDKFHNVLKLHNREGETINVQLRKYREGDEDGMISCIRDEYADTYFRKDFYDPEYIRKTAKEGNITFLVAVTDDEEVIGMMVLKRFYPKESMCEIASQIFRKKYRGYGLAMPFFQYGMELLSEGAYSAAFCLPVMFHNVTQRLLQRLDMHATGLMPNVFDIECVTHSYHNGRNRKHSQGIQIRAFHKKDAGTLYIPEEHGAFFRNTYDTLGVSYRFAKIDRHAAEELYEEFPTCSEIDYTNNDAHKSLEIRVHRVGRDLEKQIMQLYTRYPLKDKQTAVLLLNCNDAGAVWGYEILKQMGYFFAGLKPLCSEREYMVLHHPGQVEICFQDYSTSGEFDELVKYIDSCYRQRNSV